MLTMSKFGVNGRVGNQIFQYSFLYSLSKNLGAKFFLYERLDDNKSNFETINELSQFDIKSIPDCIWIKDQQEYTDLFNSTIKHKFNEPHFHFLPEYVNIPDNTDVNGFFQTEKYFREYKENLKKIFTLVYKSDSCKQYEELIKDNNFISLHVRRGDYVNKQNFHTNLSGTDYYIKAVNYFQNKSNGNSKFLVFSDNISFCKEYFQKYFDEYPDSFEYVSGTSGAEDIHLQNLCLGNVIGNSTFSWFGAFFNKNNDNSVIAPKNWFGSEATSQGIDPKDLYCENWVIM